MAKPIYNTELYKKFYEQLIPLLKGPNIKNVDLDWLEPRAREFGTKTKYGSYGWRSFVSNRLAAKTVYLGSEYVQLPNPDENQKQLIERVPDQLEKILHYMKTLPFYHIRRQMGDNDIFNPICELYVCTADPKNYRIGYMWGNTLLKPTSRPGPNLIMIHIPEEHQMRQQILTFPEYNLNIALGTDYMGEDKKGFLRQAMFLADEQGMLGLHAGTKLVTAMDAKTGKLKRYGIFLFGMTATGKSTWSCHQLGLDHTRGEKTEVAQDDIVFLRKDGSALGTENGFYVKTDIVPEQQEAMYYALTDKTALLENVMINYDGEIQFLDESLCANGRAIVFRDKLRVKRDGKLIGISSKSINLPSLDELDGLIFAFITRRNTIMPFAQELTAEQGVLAYLWGESTHSFATNPAKAGESVRIVGTDDFIIGSRARKVNRFYDIVMELTSKYPNKVKFMMYNTGGMGEIIDVKEEGGKIKKTLVRKTNRVPLELMAAIQRGDLRGTNKYELGILGTKSIVSCEGKTLSEWDVYKFYNEEQIGNYIRDLVDGRRKWTEEIASEGLKQEIINAAEKAFAIERTYGKKYVYVPSAYGEREVVVESEEQFTRPRKPGSWRWR
ncbi:MAG: phosphoenolpyruvate carboxykinase [Ignavibacteriae bacterium]|nr:MAG: phosphoenolpyruvate carboxykinase [Ignavibacteriota bacterium]